MSSVSQLHPTLHSAMDYSLPGSSVHGILQARIPEWVAISFSRESSQARDQTCISGISCIGRQILFHFAPGEAPLYVLLHLFVTSVLEGHLLVLDSFYRWGNRGSERIRATVHTQAIKLPTRFRYLLRSIDTHMQMYIMQSRSPCFICLLFVGSGEMKEGKILVSDFIVNHFLHSYLLCTKPPISCWSLYT